MKIVFEENVDDIFGVSWRWEKWNRGRISDTGMRYRDIGLSTFLYYFRFQPFFSSTLLA